LRRWRLVSGSKLSVKNKIQATGLLAVRYSYQYCVAEFTKLVKYVDSKEDPLIQIVCMHQHSFNAAMLRRARRPKRELKRGIRQIKDSTAKKIKEI
jgi:hypothetical protein